MNDVYITNISSFLPGEPVTNEEMEGFFDDSRISAKIRNITLRRNGIKARHYVIDKHSKEVTMNNAQMTAKAVKKLENANFNLNDLDCLVCATSSPDQLVPNHAVMTQGELGLPIHEVVSTSGVCLCGITALKYAYMAVACGEHKQAVSTGSEISSLVFTSQKNTYENITSDEEVEKRPELTFEKQFLRWMLSDGSGAILLGNKPSSTGISLKINWIELFSYAGEQEVCMYQGGGKTKRRQLQRMDGFPG